MQTGGDAFCATTAAQSVAVATYAKKYRMMKKKLHLLVYEQESFLDELKRSQRKLLRIERDKAFLLDRLIEFENRAESSSSDSESTASSDSEPARGEKRRKVPSQQTHRIATSGGAIGGNQQPPGGSRALYDQRKRPSTAKVKAAGSTSSTRLAHSRHNPTSGHASASSFAPPPMPDHESSLTREEIERRLELRRLHRSHFMNIGVTPPHSLPDDIFSHDNSNPHDDCEMGIGADGAMAVKVEDDEDANLVIDMAN